MRTDRRWKWATAVLVVLLGWAVAMPSAVAHTSEGLRHMVEEVHAMTTSLQRQTGAVEQKVGALPADPAATADITASTRALVQAVGQRGFLETEVEPYECETVVPAPLAGTARLATISVFRVEHYGAPVEVEVHRRDGSLMTSYALQVDGAETFVATAYDGHGIEVCEEDGGDAPIRVNAQWDDRPLSE